MKINILSKEKNALLEREEISFEVKDSKTIPSRKELRDSLAALTETKPDNVVVGKINSTFGNQKFTSSAKIYKDLNVLEKTELSYLKHRNRGTKAEKKKKKTVGEEKK